MAPPPRLLPVQGALGLKRLTRFNIRGGRGGWDVFRRWKGVERDEVEDEKCSVEQRGGQ